VPPDRASPPAWVERLQALALRVFGSRRVTRARAVIDRFNNAEGGLIASGIAYNTLFALIPMALFASSILGFFVTDPAQLEQVRDALTDWAPPLEGVVDEVLDGLATAAPSLSIIGFLGMVWGTTRLFGSLEMGIESMFSGAPRRGLVVKTVRRALSIMILVAIIALAVVATSASSLLPDISGVGGEATRALVDVVLFVLPLALGTLAVGFIYRFLPPVRPGLSAIGRPSIAIGFGLVVITRLFTILAPLALGSNFVYGTLGAIFVALTWLGLTYTIVLIGAAWVSERMIGTEETASVA
jgi:membrane protein